MTHNDRTLCLIDGSGYIFRAFYALPPMTRPDGVSVNAVYGFTNMMMNLLKENSTSHLVVVFDAARKNFRNLIYPKYKANRTDPPEDLIPQFPLIRLACDALNVPHIEMEGYEADDLIATYARHATEQGWQVTVISGDKDLMQLMNSQVSLYDPMKKKMLTTQDVLDKFGVSPNKVPDVQALMGDSTDNVPGAMGIGPKTAASLIQNFGSLDNLLEHLDDVTPDRRRDGLKRDKEQILISKRLVELDTNVPVLKDFHDFQTQPYNVEKLLLFLQQNNFQSLIKKLDAPTVHISVQQKTSQTIQKKYDLITSEIDLVNYLSKIKDMCVMTLVTDNTMSVGMALCSEKAYAVYIPFTTAEYTNVPDLFTPQSKTVGIPISKVVQLLSSTLSNSKIIKIACDIKTFCHHLKLKTIPENCDDIQLMSYELDGSKHAHELSDMAKVFLNTTLQNPTDLCGTGKAKKSLSDISSEEILPIAASEVFTVYDLFNHIKNLLHQQNKLLEIYQDIDKPLLPILYQMEITGVMVDIPRLQELDKLFTDKLSELAQQIYKEAGEEFNINSPVQLGVILYEKRGLSGGKRGANGHWITDVKALESLSENGDSLARLLLKYRSFSKLKSTYIDALISLAIKDPRIHTTYSLVNTNTGRLASSNPNLQNIPIRTEEGKEIRKVFIARPNYLILAADYSQIELRLMAHVANVQKLKLSFENNEDIHARTASQVLHIPLQDITSDQRRQAKAINFGIIYGISAFGLAANLGISREEAKQYIDTYFEQYPEIKTYMSQTQQFAEENGYVKTPFGRKIYLPGLQNKATKSFALRAAINAPIQGGAADIIKMAMIRIIKNLQDSSLNCQLLLQIHDELVFEVSKSDAEKAKQLIKTAMEKVVSLSIPLVADVNIGHDWKEAH